MRAGSLQTSPSVCHNAPGSCCLASTGCAPIAAGLACCFLYSQHTADLVLAKHLSHSLISLNPTKTSLSLKARSETNCGPTVTPKAKPNSPWAIIGPYGVATPPIDTPLSKDVEQIPCLRESSWSRMGLVKLGQGWRPTIPEVLMSLGVPYSYASSCGETSPVYLTSSADSSIPGNLSPSWEVGSHFGGQQAWVRLFICRPCFSIEHVVKNPASHKHFYFFPPELAPKHIVSHICTLTWKLLLIIFHICCFSPGNSGFPILGTWEKRSLMSLRIIFAPWSLVMRPMTATGSTVSTGALVPLTTMN